MRYDNTTKQLPRRRRALYIQQPREATDLLHYKTVASQGCKKVFQIECSQSLFIRPQIRLANSSSFSNSTF